jgi:hypothetical protein
MTLRYIEVQFAVLAVVSIAAWAFQHFPAPFEAVEKFFARVAERKRLALFCVAGAAILLRVSFLPLLPIPVPEVHDEFAYLLQGDTFAHGRLANPPHLMWIYFDTFHVNQHPTYSSIFPPGQGVMLAIGQLFGHPWIGVLLSVSLMCAAVLWALQGWLPAHWAFFGGALVVLRFSISSYWINSYWGGAVAATGAALVIGALPRIVHLHRGRDAVILGLGATILANSRPFEGFIFCLPVAVFLAVWLCGPRSPAWRQTLPRLVFPFCTVMLVCGLFIGYYNWRLTGDPALFPHVLNIRNHCSVPQFVWEKSKPPFHFLNAQFESYYNGWWPSTAWPTGRPDSPEKVVRTVGSNLWMFIRFFLWPELCLPMLALPWILRDRRMRLLLVQFVSCFAGFLLVAWFQPHYAAALTATTFILITQGLRHIRHWRFGSRLFGVGLVRALAVLALLLAPFHRYYVGLFPAVDTRARIASQIQSTAGTSLVIVRYDPDHNPLEEWVYNRADIDRAKIIWAREIPAVSMQPLLDYFHDRKVWLVEPDENPPKLFQLTPLLHKR